METPFQIINIADIYAGEELNYSRGEINKIDVANLAKDIETQTPISPETMGLLNPVTVRVLGEEEAKHFNKPFALVAGFRRFFAFTVLNRDKIPCMVKAHLSKEQSVILNLSENLNRQDLNILQEAKGLKYLKDMRIGRDHVAKALGVSSGWVQIRYNLLDLPEDIQKEAAVGIINQNHVKQLYAIRDDKEQLYEAVRKIKDHKLKDNARAEDLQIIKPIAGADVKRVRKRPEMFELMQYLAGLFGYGLYTRVIAWSMGEITDGDLLSDIVLYAKENDVDFTPPANGTFLDGRT